MTDDDVDDAIRGMRGIAWPVREGDPVTLVMVDGRVVRTTVSQVNGNWFTSVTCAARNRYEVDISWAPGWDTKRANALVSQRG